MMKNGKSRRQGKSPTHREILRLDLLAMLYAMEVRRLQQRITQMEIDSGLYDYARGM